MFDTFTYFRSVLFLAAFLCFGMVNSHPFTARSRCQIRLADAESYRILAAFETLSDNSELTVDGQSHSTAAPSRCLPPEYQMQILPVKGVLGCVNRNRNRNRRCDQRVSSSQQA